MPDNKLKSIEDRVKNLMPLAYFPKYTFLIDSSASLIKYAFSLYACKMVSYPSSDWQMKFQKSLPISNSSGAKIVSLVLAAKFSPLRIYCKL
jgi:hypothetical protein